MPSRGNPNVPNKQRRIASRSKVQKRNAQSKVTKNARGTFKSNVLAPTSGPLAPVSAKKARKLDRAQNNAKRRALEKGMEERGEVEMTDAPKTTMAKPTKPEEERMEVDTVS